MEILGWEREGGAGLGVGLKQEGPDLDLT